MRKQIFDLYCRAIKGTRWVENNKGKPNHLAGVERLDDIYNELASLGYPRYPKVITDDPKDRFGYPNREYLKTLPLEEHNDYVRLKFEETSVMLDERKKLT